ncbi:MAG: hypothetical protein ABIH92_01540 [Nanoarchaeota archaeon]
MGTGGRGAGRWATAQFTWLRIGLSIHLERACYATIRVYPLGAWPPSRRDLEVDRRDFIISLEQYCTEVAA